MQPNLQLAKKLNTIATIISVILLLIVAVNPFRINTTIDFSFLPPFHSTVNGFVAISLLAALYFIKNKNVEAHRKAIYVAFGLSVLFLLSYVTYRSTTPETKFGGEGIIRYIYFFFLITHIILAAVSLPLILFTFIRAYTGQIERHRKMAKWVYPLWLYVAITGPICYLMLKPYF